ncbi:MAG TPA: hypothetical protein VF765_02535 [Polyangiaceae bacterium]
MGAMKRLDKNALKMVLLSYPLLLAVDAIVLQAVVPAHLAVLQIAHAVLGVSGFVWLLRAYRAR